MANQCTGDSQTRVNRKYQIDLYRRFGVANRSEEELSNLVIVSTNNELNSNQ